MKPIHIFYHLFTVNKWRQLFTYHINSIVKSGLYDACTNMHLGIVFQHPSDLKDVRGIEQQYPKLNIIGVREYNDLPVKIWNDPEQYMNVQPGECETILKLVEFAKKNNEDSNYLFLHSKGVTHPNDKNRNQIKYFYGKGLNQEADKNTTAEFILEDLTNNVVFNWKEIISLLNTNNYYHYVFNFFWLSGEALNQFELENYDKFSTKGKKHGRNNRHYTARFPINLYEANNKVTIRNQGQIIPFLK